MKHESRPIWPTHTANHWIEFIRWVQWCHRNSIFSHKYGISPYVLNWLRIKIRPERSTQKQRTHPNKTRQGGFNPTVPTPKKSYPINSSIPSTHPLRHSGAVKQPPRLRIRGGGMKNKFAGCHGQRANASRPCQLCKSYLLGTATMY